MQWWLWLAGGLALIVAELVAPGGFFLIFLGFGALAVGMLTALGAVTSLWPQVLLVAVLTVTFLVAFRGRLRARFQMPPPNDIDSFVGKLAVVQERLAPGSVGRVEVRGAAWSARNTSAVTLDPGQRARVASVDGLLLTVVPE